MGSFSWPLTLPESYGDLHITNAPMASSKITIDIVGSTATIRGLPEGMLFRRGTRPRAADLVEQAKLRGKPGRSLNVPNGGSVAIGRGDE
jgi:hypothetical protein